MPNGERPSLRCTACGVPRRGPARGFTYLGVLLAAALASALMAGLLQRSSQAEQRERERELLFRGRQIRAAIEAYQAAAEPAVLPHSLDELLADRREQPPVHHLRRRWTDPLTGQADWVLITRPQPDGSSGIAGVHSRASRRLLLRATGEADLQGVVASDWRFVTRQVAPAADGGGPAGQGAAAAGPAAASAAAAREGGPPAPGVTSW